MIDGSPLALARSSALHVEERERTSSPFFESAAASAGVLERVELDHARSALDFRGQVVVCSASTWAQLQGGSGSESGSAGATVDVVWISWSVRAIGPPAAAKESIS